MFWFSRQKPEDTPIAGLVLPGGGARNAYQVGVLRAIAEIIPEDVHSPFPVITGTSSGAINAAVLAAYAGQYREGVGQLEDVWGNFHVGKVFRADTLTAVVAGLRWILTLVTAGLGPDSPRSILDNQPLRELLTERIDMKRIQKAIDNGHLRALGINASSYKSGYSICYYQGVKDIIAWERTQRRGIPRELRIDHLMASIAIPLIFPAVKINGEYHGDGTMRETAPLSPALHLGANRLLIIGIQDDPRKYHQVDSADYPSIGQIAGYVLDTLFLDSLNADIERMKRINLTISETRENRVEVKDTTLRPIEFLVVSPSEDIGSYAERYIKNVPGSVRALLRGMGALNREGRPLISYLLFEAGFCREMMELGYRDGMDQKEAILKIVCP